LYGRCDEGLRVPYQPFVETLGAYTDTARSDRLAAQLGSTGEELGRLLPGLASRVTGLGAPTESDFETERWLLFQAVALFLKALAAEREVVLVFDDLHWAEPATLLLLRHLARAAIDRLTILATARASEQTDPGTWAEAMADLARDNLLDTITLTGLSVDDVAALVAERFQYPAELSFIQTVHAETGGNPFFTHELITHLAELGLLSERADERGWPTPAEIERSGASEGIRQVLTRRIHQLSPTAQAVLDVASVAGGEFDAHDVAEVVGGVPHDVVVALEEAATSGLISETRRGPGEYRFVHALVRHTLYESGSTLHRAQMHWRMAEAIRTLTRPPTRRLNELAYHYRKGLDASDPAIAVQWLQQAGDHATHQVAFEEAFEHYRAALLALDMGPEDTRRRYHLLAGLGESAAAVSDFEGSQDFWLKAAEIARAAKDPSAFRRALEGYGSIISYPAEDETLQRLIDQGLEIVGSADSAVKAQFLAHDAEQMWRRGRGRPLHEREARARDALAMASRVNDPRAKASALSALVHVLAGSSQAGERIAACTEILRLLETLGLEARTWAVHRDLALAAIQLGQLSRAQAGLEQALTVASASNWKLGQHNVLTLQAAMAIAEGDLDNAKRLVAEARVVGGATNITIALSYGAQLAAVRAEQGQTQKVIDALSTLSEDPSPGTLAWRVMLAGLYADVGRLDEALAHFEQVAPEGFALIPRDWAFPLAIRYLAEICAHLSDSEGAAQLLAEVVPYSGQLLVVSLGTSIEGAADRSLGQLYGVLGLFEEADRHYQEAWRLEESMGFAPLAARSRYWHARLLAQSTDSNDRNRARHLLRTAGGTAGALGMVLLEKQSNDLYKRLNPHDGAPASGP
jgi:tetratricopeptide (TPR) repeat protein